MPRFIDLTGQQFGRLTVISEAPKHKGRTAWNCKCCCGNEVVVIGKSLRSGNTKSCGCLSRDKSSERYKVLNLKHGCTNTTLFNRWLGMHARCEQKSMPNYSNYGSRGISVCDEWKTFELFKQWAENNGYEDSLTLDRIDVNGNYCPDNCRWATPQEQSENKRNSRLYTIDGESHCLSYWSRKFGLPSSTIGRKTKGKSEEEIKQIVAEYARRLL